MRRARESGVSRSVKNKHCLVTGGAGFIGSHLVEALVGRGAKVTIADSLSTGRVSNLASVADQVDLRKLDLITDDLRPLLSENGFSHVFHLAANANVVGSVEDPRHDFERNALATFNLLDAVRDAAPKATIVHTSSATVYGEGHSAPIKEDDPKDPISPYGVSKLTAEGYVSLFSRLYGLRTANVRLFSVYGPRLRKQVVYDLMLKLTKNTDELFIHGDGTQVRDMNHVANIAETLILVVEKAPLSGEVYNVAAGEQVSIRELAEMICQRLQLSPKFVFSGKVRLGESHAWYPDITELEKLGYCPRLKLERGLSDTVDWFRREVMNKNGERDGKK